MQVVVIDFIWDRWRLKLLMSLGGRSLTWIRSQYACLVVFAHIINNRGLMPEDNFLALNYWGSRLGHWTLGRDTATVVFLSTNFISDTHVLVEVYPVIKSSSRESFRMSLLTQSFPYIRLTVTLTLLGLSVLFYESGLACGELILVEHDAIEVFVFILLFDYHRVCLLYCVHCWNRVEFAAVEGLTLFLGLTIHQIWLQSSGLDNPIDLQVGS